MFVVDSSGRLDIPWDDLEGMLKGISAIDMTRFTIRDYEDAELFVQNYGYNLRLDDDKDEIYAIQQEAISFIERYLLNPEIDWSESEEEPLVLEVPKSFKDNLDIRDLLFIAANDQGILQRWACAILKVMHTICHINNAILYRYFKEAKSQIFYRYEQILNRSDTGEIILGQPGSMQISVAAFEIKDEKSRDSMILKLLCKRENVAEEIFDMVGVRVITFTSAEAVLALEVLRQNKVVIFPNIIPSRSRNSLVDFDMFRINYEEIIDDYRWGTTGLNQTLGLLSKIVTEKPDESFNPQNNSSHLTYRSIHLTERQLIRFKIPGAQQETRFFFPYELQIVDESHYNQNVSGSSAHMLYKQRQLVQARRRVLGPLFITLRKHYHGKNKGLEAEPLS